MKRIILISITIIISFSTTSEAQTFDPYYATIVDEVSMDNIVADLTTFESFGVKEIGTTALDNAENWITDRYILLRLGQMRVARLPVDFFSSRLQYCW